MTDSKPLAGIRALVTAGPTLEPIDPVRFIANRSSGKQGFAVAEALAQAGAEVALISGATSLPAPDGVKHVREVTARDMLKAVQDALPVDVAVFAAAVADWRPETVSKEKIKKTGPTLTLTLTQNPDILATIAKGSPRPKLVVGFAAETENLEQNAIAKLARKGCDWIVANDVSDGAVFGDDDNRVVLVTADGIEPWPEGSKREVAEKLVSRIVEALKGT